MKASALLLVSLLGVDAHGKLLCPAPRQLRDTNPMATWTSWVGITVPGDASLRPGAWDANALNAAIGGANPTSATPGSHGLCGDIGSRNAFNDAAIFGPTEPRGTFVAGGTMDVKILVQAYHAGWFEFRLAVPADGGKDKSVPITQSLLNEHVLQIDPTTPDYAAHTNWAAMRSAQGSGGSIKCKDNAGFVDPTATSSNTFWPHGTCCNGGGKCSDPMANTDRYTIDREEQTYEVVLKVPAGIQCERCVLQWAYITGNSPDESPETFWNCADVEIKPAGFSGATGCKSSPAGASSSSSSSSGSVVRPVAPEADPSGFCSTTWAEYGGGKTAQCVTCTSDADCSGGRSCWGQTYCREGILCGAAECAAAISTSTDASPAPLRPIRIPPQAEKPASGKCVGTGAWANNPGMDEWCTTTCTSRAPNTVCPANMCQCH